MKKRLLRQKSPVIMHLLKYKPRPKSKQILIARKIEKSLNKLKRKARMQQPSKKPPMKNGLLIKKSLPIKKQRVRRKKTLLTRAN